MKVKEIILATRVGKKNLSSPFHIWDTGAQKRYGLSKIILELFVRFWNQVCCSTFHALNSDHLLLLFIRTEQYLLTQTFDGPCLSYEVWRGEQKAFSLEQLLRTTHITPAVLLLWRT